MSDAPTSLKETHPHDVLDARLGLGQQAGFPFSATKHSQDVEDCSHGRTTCCTDRTSRTRWSRHQPANTGCLRSGFGHVQWSHCPPFFDRERSAVSRETPRDGA